MNSRITSLLEKRGGRILVAYYVSGRGPALLIDVLTKEHLDRLLVAFRRLSLTSNASLEITIDDFAFFDCLSSLTLRVSEDGSSVVMNEALDCLWSDTLEGWLHNLELCEVFEATSAFGHQYLSDHNPDVEIEFAFMEPHFGPDD